MLMHILQKYWWLILAWLLAMFGDDFWKFNIMELFASIAIIIGAIWAIVGWFRQRRRKGERKAIRRELDTLIARGEWIQARLTATTEAAYDQSDSYIRDWTESVQKKIKNTEDGGIFLSNAGLPKIEPEGLTALAQLNNVNKKYMANRLSRLKEIRDKLGY